MQSTLLALVALAAVTHSTDSESLQPTDPRSHVVSFLDGTIKQSRYSSPYHMECHVDYSYPEHRETNVPTGAAYRYWVAPPRCRSEASIGPWEPRFQAPIKRIYVDNGQSEAALRYDHKSRQNAAVVTRDRKAHDSAWRNIYWYELGIPTAHDDIEQSQHGSYFLREAVTSANGYSVKPDTETIRGTTCVVISKADEDCIWFSADAPTRLIKRDYWRTMRSPVRHVLEYSDYRDDGLPATILHTKYLAADRLGAPTAIRGVEELHLDVVNFETPSNDLFTLDIDDHVGILDINTHTTYHTGNITQFPFEKLLRFSKITPPPPRSFTGVIVAINCLIFSLLFLVWAARRVKHK